MAAKLIEIQALEPLMVKGERVEPQGFTEVDKAEAAWLYSIGHARPGAEGRAEAEAKAKAEAEAKAADPAQQQLPQT